MSRNREHASGGPSGLLSGSLGGEGCGLGSIGRGPPGNDWVDSVVHFPAKVDGGLAGIGEGRARVGAERYPLRVLAAHAVDEPPGLRAGRLSRAG